jgi:hypothetical protein
MVLARKCKRFFYDPHVLFSRLLLSELHVSAYMVESDPFLESLTGSALCQIKATHDSRARVDDMSAQPRFILSQYKGKPLFDNALTCRPWERFPHKELGSVWRQLPITRAFPISIKIQMSCLFGWHLQLL